MVLWDSCKTDTAWKTCVNGMMILKYVLRCRDDVDLIALAEVRGRVLCEHVNEPRGFIKYG